MHSLWVTKRKLIPLGVCTLNMAKQPTVCLLYLAARLAMSGTPAAQRLITFMTGFFKQTAQKRLLVVTASHKFPDWFIWHHEMLQWFLVKNAIEPINIEKGEIINQSAPEAGLWPWAFLRWSRSNNKSRNEIEATLRAVFNQLKVWDEQLITLTSPGKEKR